MPSEWRPCNWLKLVLLKKREIVHLKKQISFSFINSAEIVPLSEWEPLSVYLTDYLGHELINVVYDEKEL